MLKVVSFFGKLDSIEGSNSGFRLPRPFFAFRFLNSWKSEEFGFFLGLLFVNGVCNVLKYLFQCFSCGRLFLNCFA